MILKCRTEGVEYYNTMISYYLVEPFTNVKVSITHPSNLNQIMTKVDDKTLKNGIELTSPNGWE